MRVEQVREQVFTVTATSQELSALVAGARMSLQIMRARETEATAPAAQMLERVLADFDRARERAVGPGDQG